ncbi:MAG: shikimate kinase, partial [Pseudomonadota bacterium]
MTRHLAANGITLLIVALIGLRATGKSTVGQRLAARLGWSFVDTDALLAAQVGMPAGEFLAERGEA